LDKLKRQIKEAKEKKKMEKLLAQQSKSSSVIDVQLTAMEENDDLFTVKSTSTRREVVRDDQQLESEQHSSAVQATSTKEKKKVKPLKIRADGRVKQSSSNSSSGTVKKVKFDDEGNPCDAQSIQLVHLLPVAGISIDRDRIAAHTLQVMERIAQTRDADVMREKKRVRDKRLSFKQAIKGSAKTLDGPATLWNADEEGMDTDEHHQSDAAMDSRELIIRTYNHSDANIVVDKTDKVSRKRQLNEEVAATIDSQPREKQSRKNKKSKKVTSPHSVDGCSDDDDHIDVDDIRSQEALALQLIDRS